MTVRPPSSASSSSSSSSACLCACRNVNRHKRSQSSPLNLPVDIPEASSGDEEAVGSPGARAREHDSLIQEVSHSICQPTPLGVTQCVTVVGVGTQHWISHTPSRYLAKTACTSVIITMSPSRLLFSCDCLPCNDDYRSLIISKSRQKGRRYSRSLSKLPTSQHSSSLKTTFNQACIRRTSCLWFE